MQKRIQDGSPVAIRPMFSWWDWTPAKVVNSMENCGNVWYCVVYASHAGGYTHMFLEYYVVPVEFEPKE